MAEMSRVYWTTRRNWPEQSGEVMLPGNLRWYDYRCVVLCMVCLESLKRAAR